MIKEQAIANCRDGVLNHLSFKNYGMNVIGLQGHTLDGHDMGKTAVGTCCLQANSVASMM